MATAMVLLLTAAVQFYYYLEISDLVDLFVKHHLTLFNMRRPNSCLYLPANGYCTNEHMFKCYHGVMFSFLQFVEFFIVSYPEQNALFGI